MDQLGFENLIVVKEYRENELYEIMSQMMVSDLQKNRRYNEIPDEIEEIYEKYPRIRSILEWKYLEALTEEEVGALLNVLALEDDMYDIEQMVLLREAQRVVVRLFRDS